MKNKYILIVISCLIVYISAVKYEGNEHHTLCSEGAKEFDRWLVAKHGPRQPIVKNGFRLSPNPRSGHRLESDVKEIKIENKKEINKYDTLVIYSYKDDTTKETDIVTLYIGNKMNAMERSNSKFHYTEQPVPKRAATENLVEFTVDDGAKQIPKNVKEKTVTFSEANRQKMQIKANDEIKYVIFGRIGKNLKMLGLFAFTTGTPGTNYVTKTHAWVNHIRISLKVRVQRVKFDGQVWKDGILLENHSGPASIALRFADICALAGDFFAGSQVDRAKDKSQPGPEGILGGIISFNMEKSKREGKTVLYSPDVAAKRFEFNVFDQWYKPLVGENPSQIGYGEGNKKVPLSSHVHVKEAVKQEAVKQEAVKQEAVKQEAVKQEAVKQEAVKQEAKTKADGTLTSTTLEHEQEKYNSVVSMVLADFNMQKSAHARNKDAPWNAYAESDTDAKRPVKLERITNAHEERLGYISNDQLPDTGERSNTASMAYQLSTKEWATSPYARGLLYNFDHFGESGAIQSYFVGHQVACRTANMAGIIFRGRNYNKDGGKHEANADVNKDYPLRSKEEAGPSQSKSKAPPRPPRPSRSQMTSVRAMLQNNAPKHSPRSFPSNDQRYKRAFNLIRKAFLQEGAALHFATDQFAAGHVRAARGLFYVDMNDSKLGHSCGKHDDMSGMPSPMEMMGLLANVQHDEENMLGIKVKDQTGKTPWSAFGDKYFFSSKNALNRQYGRHFVRESLKEVYKCFTHMIKQGAIQSVEQGYLNSGDNKLRAVRLVPVAANQHTYPPLFAKNPRDKTWYYRQTKPWDVKKVGQPCFTKSCPASSSDAVYHSDFDCKPVRNKWISAVPALGLAQIWKSKSTLIGRKSDQSTQKTAAKLHSNPYIQSLKTKPLLDNFVEHDLSHN